NCTFYLGTTPTSYLATFSFNHTVTTLLYTLSLHDALPIFAHNKVNLAGCKHYSYHIGVYEVEYLRLGRGGFHPQSGFIIYSYGSGYVLEEKQCNRSNPFYDFGNGNLDLFRILSA